MARVPGTQRGCLGASQVPGCHLVMVDASTSHWCPAKCITPKRKEGRKEGRQEGLCPGRGLDELLPRRRTREYAESLILRAIRLRYPTKNVMCLYSRAASLRFHHRWTRRTMTWNHEALESTLSLSCFPDAISNTIRVHQLASPSIKLRQ